MKLPALLVFLFLLPGSAPGAGTAGPVALPGWFTETFLDFREDVAQAAREAFITSATNFVTPVVRIDGKPIGNGAPGLIASALRRDYHGRAEIA